jgi:peptidoglycan/LPS O-acetylase OafA/YrhL
MISQTFWGVFVQGQYALAPQQNSYTGVLWTMSIELIGSFLVFSFASLFGRLRNRWVFYLVSSVLFFNSYYLAFILGMALADLYTSAAAERARIRNPAILAILLVLAILLGTYPALPLHDAFYTGIGLVGTAATTLLPFAALSAFPLTSSSSIDLLYIAGSFLLLVVVLNSSLSAGLLSSRIPVFLGKISFSLYLIHMLVINTFSFFLLRYLFDYQLTPWDGIAIFVLTLPVLFAASYLMYRYVDVPGVALSKWVYLRFFSREKNDPR